MRIICQYTLNREIEKIHLISARTIEINNSAILLLCFIFHLYNIFNWNYCSNKQQYRQKKLIKIYVIYSLISLLIMLGYALISHSLVLCLSPYIHLFFLSTYYLFPLVNLFMKLCSSYFQITSWPYRLHSIFKQTTMCVYICIYVYLCVHAYIYIHKYLSYT